MFYTLYFTIYKKLSSPTIKEREMKFNKLPDNLSIKLINGTRNSILLMKDYITDRENLLKNLLI